jgi:hypothetical protein
MHPPDRSLLPLATGRLTRQFAGGRADGSADGGAMQMGARCKGSASVDDAYTVLYIASRSIKKSVDRKEKERKILYSYASETAAGIISSVNRTCRS